MELSRIVKPLVYIIVNCSVLYFFQVILKQPIRIIEAIVLVAIGSIISMCILSIYNNYQQFFRALRERIIRPFALIAILALRIYGFVTSFFLRCYRLVIGLLITAVYGVSPIDIIPDFFLGIGQIDDMLVALISISWGIFYIRRSIVSSVRVTVKNLEFSTQIKTKFP